MMLKLLDQFRDIESTESEGKPSRHTGRFLREVEIELNCDDTLNAQLTHELNAAREESAALEGDDGARWVVVGFHSYSVSNGGAWHFTVALREVEELRAESLEFLGLRLAPLHFEESADRDGSLVIVAAVAPGAEESETLEHHIVEQWTRNEGEATPYFDLRRVGVQDEPLQVRFGRCLWQKGEGGARRHLLVFVAADGDDDDTRRGFVGINEPRGTNAARAALQGREVAEAIIDELGLAGLLSQEAIERIRQRGESAWDKRFRDLNETSDLSLFH